MGKSQARLIARPTPISCPRVQAILSGEIMNEPENAPLCVLEFPVTL